MPRVPEPSDDDFRALLACPACGGGLGSRSLGCAGCGVVYPIADGVADLRLRERGDARTETVRTFYGDAPFPGYPPRLTLSALRARASRSEFAMLLDAAIPGDARVVEVGCGTGQMSLFLATAERLVVGADLTRASLELAADAARRFGLRRVRFVETDLFSPGLAAGSFDVVYSSGVLHHTPDPPAAFAAVARLARPGGIVVIGLYNVFARLLHRLRRVIARATRYRVIPFDPVLRDRAAEPARHEAWLRDQYRHPEEHRHTLGEVRRWFRDNDIEYLRAYPSSTLAEATLSGRELFGPSIDDWSVEELLVQLGWLTRLAHEGGLFVTIGRRR